MYKKPQYFIFIILLLPLFSFAAPPKKVLFQVPYQYLRYEETVVTDKEYKSLQNSLYTLITKLMYISIDNFESDQIIPGQFHVRRIDDINNDKIPDYLVEVQSMTSSEKTSLPVLSNSGKYGLMTITPQFPVQWLLSKEDSGGVDFASKENKIFLYNYKNDKADNTRTRCTVVILYTYNESTGKYTQTYPDATDPVLIDGICGNKTAKGASSQQNFPIPEKLNEPASNSLPRNQNNIKWLKARYKSLIVYYPAGFSIKKYSANVGRPDATSKFDYLMIKDKNKKDFIEINNDHRFYLGCYLKEESNHTENGVVPSAESGASALIGYYGQNSDDTEYQPPICTNIHNFNITTVSDNLSVEHSKLFEEIVQKIQKVKP